VLAIEVKAGATPEETKTISDRLAEALKKAFANDQTVERAPINKEAIWAAGSEHLGHTEMLGELTGVTQQDTMFVVRNDAAGGHHLRIFFTTRHVSLRKALDQPTRQEVLERLRARPARQLRRSAAAVIRAERDSR